MEIKHGLIAYVDILGYQSLIDNNELEDLGTIMQKIVDIGDDVNKKVKEHFLAKGNKENEIDQAIIDHNVISDSIIFTKETKEITAKNITLNEDFILAFLQSMKSLCPLSFENGIALRGAVNYGDYILEDNIFASKAIIKSYHLAENLDFSGIVLCEDFIKYFNKLKAIDKRINGLMDKFTVNVICPLKEDSERELRTIDWITDFEKVEDLKQYLYNSFSMHHKKISKNVIKKIENTENVLRLIMAEKKHRK